MSKIDPKPHINAAIEDSKKRRVGILITPGFFSDEQWQEINDVLDKTGPLSDVEMLLYGTQHDHLAKQSFLGLRNECQRLYEIINQMEKR